MSKALYWRGPGTLRFSKLGKVIFPEEEIPKGLLDKMEAKELKGHKDAGQISDRTQVQEEAAARKKVETKQKAAEDEKLKAAEEAEAEKKAAEEAAEAEAEAEAKAAAEAEKKAAAAEQPNRGKVGPK